MNTFKSIARCKLKTQNVKIRNKYIDSFIHETNIYQQCTLLFENENINLSNIFNVKLMQQI